MDAPGTDISPDEYVLRRILKNPSHYDPSLPVPVQKAAVRPSQRDVNGLSVYREQYYLGNPAGVLAHVEEGKRNNYHIGRIRVSDLNRLGLTVRPAEGPEHLPGHCEIPELNHEDYEKDKRKFADVILEVAKLLGENIVYSPPPG
ncbi:Uncharacterized protein OS=Singulisphaera acidiphila (strain ATCC BAA-1392 / DSM 18658 / VKM B-2454 / MOB10) GN=Sinac_4193 PE=4 SV=1 [Gemmataceae bacterium]|nr:Uncharacterized protein OS=Singulisphaera acidiphila (strain ATCC BAA-1392 / DSM 18658 / VKM B-2454 / MOB10) GN=Sinac_4193 PE=4 SV=1 [Gemmataceae bacterium]VTU00668.1 Uncharacterized protein OS=Singulisphaera acidiphila (strain ATCC BAA-1392 / DSM 18658 / VKM B-2454 / MOB10) GN=Sinac_4193 PE=4 SV=1 [Gemmataceae bacterium]